MAQTLGASQASDGGKQDKTGGGGGGVGQDLLITPWLLLQRRATLSLEAGWQNVGGKVRVGSS